MPLLFDTDVLIDISRNQPDALTFLDSLDQPFSVSVISVTEVGAGLVRQREKQLFENLFERVPVYPVTIEIAREAGEYRQSFGKSHNVGLADALIAATAAVHQLRLVTRNRKHYPMFRDVLVPYKR